MSSSSTATTTTVTHSIATKPAILLDFYNTIFAPAEEGKRDYVDLKMLRLCADNPHFTTFIYSAAPNGVRANRTMAWLKENKIVPQIIPEERVLFCIKTQEKIGVGRCLMHFKGITKAILIDDGESKSQHPVFDEEKEKAGEADGMLICKYPLSADASTQQREAFYEQLTMRLATHENWPTLAIPRLKGKEKTLEGLLRYTDPRLARPLSHEEFASATSGSARTCSAPSRI